MKRLWEHKKATEFLFDCLTQSIPENLGILGERGLVACHVISMWYEEISFYIPPLAESLYVGEITYKPTDKFICAHSGVLVFQVTRRLDNKDQFLYSKTWGASISPHHEDIYLVEIARQWIDELLANHMALEEEREVREEEEKNKEKGIKKKNEERVRQAWSKEWVA